MIYLHFIISAKAGSNQFIAVKRKQIATCRPPACLSKIDVLFFNVTRLPKEVVQNLTYSWYFRKSSLKFAEPLTRFSKIVPFFP